MFHCDGFHLKTFKNDDSTIIRLAVVSVDFLKEKLNLNVIQEHAGAIEKCLGSLVQNKNVDIYEIWLSIVGMENIIKTLILLKEKNFISQDFYTSIVCAFPKADGGSIDLLSKSTTAYAQLFNYSIFEKKALPRATASEEEFIEITSSPDHSTP